MLLIGVDGSGKSTIMELATYISNCEVFKLNVKKGYQYADFRDDLKIVFKLAGVQRKKIVFFIADKDIYEVSAFENFLTTEFHNFVSIITSNLKTNQYTQNL